MTTTPDTTPPAAAAKTRTAKPATKQPSRVAHHLSQWTPDPRWAHPVAATLWLYCIAVAVTRPGYQVPPMLLAVLAPIGIVLSILRSKRTFPERDYGHDVGQSMAWLGGVASVMAAGWLVYAGLAGPWQALPYLVLIAVFAGAWYAVIRTGAPKVKAAIADEREAARIEAVTATWQALLQSSKIGLKVVEARPTRAGYVLGVEPADPSKPVSFDQLRMRLTDLTTLAASTLARDGVTVGANTIRIEETEAAHVHLIHVCTKNILRESIPYEPFAEAPGTIADPIDIGLYEDGQEVTVTFGGSEGGVNGIHVGATGSGKSVLTNVEIARVGECGDVLLGVVASAKLVPLVYPWLKPWLEGKTAKPAIDFVAGQDPEEVLLMLAAVYQIVCDYNAQLSNEPTHTPTVTAPGVVLWVEEAGKMATRPEKIVTHDKLTVGFSQLVHLIDGECRSAQTSLILLNQMALFESFGDYGSEIQRNTPFRICLKTLSASDGQNTLPGVQAARADTTRLRHNSMLVQPSADEPRAMPAKAYMLVPEEIGAIAIRNAGWRPELDPDIAARLGEVWTDRWNAARLPQLAKAAARDGLTWPVGWVEDDVDVELRKILESDAPLSPKDTPMLETSGPHGFPDADAGIAELAAIANQPALILPEPLAAVMALLREPQAPSDFISTRQLAILLGRANADADEDTLKEAAEQLGREMSEIDKEIRTRQRRGGDGRARGYDIPELKQISARIAREAR